LVPIVFLTSVGHELAHGIVGKYYGFDVPEVGVHLHYFIPSFYCKILRRADANRESMLSVVLAGSLFVLVLMSVLMATWLLLAGAAAREFISTALSLLIVKVLLMELNPFWPYSDGYHSNGLLLFNERDRNER